MYYNKEHMNMVSLKTFYCTFVFSLKGKHFINSLCYIQITSITTLVFWSHY
jgi:uncharacterized membrane protein